MAQNNLKSREIFGCGEISMKGATIVYNYERTFTLHWKTRREKRKDMKRYILLTAMAVAGRNIMVNKAMLFMAEESRLVSRAICCCIRLYNYNYSMLVHRNAGMSCLRGFFNLTNLPLADTWKSFLACVGDAALPLRRGPAYAQRIV